MSLPLDVARCAGRPAGLESHKVCAKRDKCKRYEDIKSFGPATPFYTGLCQGENYEFYIPAEDT